LRIASTHDDARDTRPNSDICFDAHGGSENSGRTAILEEGAEWQVLSLTQALAATLQQMGVQRRKALERRDRHEKVPPRNCPLSRKSSMRPSVAMTC
jgi:hypothetical protein